MIGCITPQPDVKFPRRIRASGAFADQAFRLIGSGLFGIVRQFADRIIHEQQFAPLSRDLARPGCSQPCLRLDCDGQGINAMRPGLYQGKCLVLFSGRGNGRNSERSQR